MNVNPEISQWRRVGRIKRIKTSRAALGGPISAIELVVEENAHFGNVVQPSHDNGPEEIVSAVTARFKYRDLTSRDDDCFAQILQHERQGRSRIRQCVRSMKNYEPVKQFVRSLYHQKK